MAKLTKRLIDAAEVRAVEYFIWDDDIPGFGLRILPSGRKGYVTQYRAGRRPRRMSLGPSTVLTCEQARKRAITIVAAVRNGEDPAAQRDAGRKVITICQRRSKIRPLGGAKVGHLWHTHESPGRA